MEGTPTYIPPIDRDSDFDTKKKRKRLEMAPDDDNTLSASKSRHIAREALRHEETKKPAPLFAISEALLPKPQEATPETEDDEESEEVEGMDKQDRQHAAQALRRESRSNRPEADAEGDEPAVIKAGDLLVDDWDDRIEAGQDLDEALEDVFQDYDIPAELFENIPVSEAEPDWKPETPSLPKPDIESTEYTPREFDDREVVINSHEASADQSPAEDVKTAESAPANVSQRPVAERQEHTSTPRAVIENVADHFIQRRGGANKPEKKSQPSRDKLEEQVDDLSWELKAKEAKIRQVAAEYVQQKGPAILEIMTAKLFKRTEGKAGQSYDEKIDQVETGSSTPYVANRLLERRQRAPEANKLHGGAGAASEHIGRVVVTAEAAERSGKETPKSELTKEKIQLPPNKRIETLSRPELLAMSEHISVEGSNLRQIYETHLIGEQALRRLVAAYLHNGDVAKALQREIVEHEIDFERDPALRDIAVPGETDDDDNEAKQLAAPGKEALNQLLQKAEAGMAVSDEDLVYDKTDPQDNKQRQSESSTKRRPQADSVMGAIIISLVFLVALLYIWRH